ncbi:MAG: DUF5615 family PIN-like protein [Pirellulaceae bacterium]
MRLYLDDDSVNRVLIAQLRQAGHDVQIPADIGSAGEADAVHLLHALREKRVLVSYNHDDYKELHDLVIGSGGFHPGILALRRDGDRRRDMRPFQVVGAIGKFIASGSPFVDSFNVLNHWR